MSNLSALLGARLREVRKKQKITQMKLAEMIGSNQWQIVKYEKGMQDMPVTRLYEIAKALGVRPVDLLV